jgi:5-methyltetrahydropteroyltriglutamate--homocysteine methyltransferase
MPVHQGDKTVITVHTDVVGSLLRPDWLLKARQDVSEKTVSPAVFKSLEDRSVDEAIALQESAGLDVITDGEMRRTSFQSQMTEAVDGFGNYTLDAFLWGDWHGNKTVGDRLLDRPANLGAVKKLTRRRFLSTEEFVYLRSKTDRIPKISLPSPSLWANFWSPKHSKEAYPTLDSFLADVTNILCEEVAELARLGTTYIQLDAPHYTAFIDSNTRIFYESQGWSADRFLDAGIELDNAVIGNFPDITFGFHL